MTWRVYLPVSLQGGEGVLTVRFRLPLLLPFQSKIDAAPKKILGIEGTIRGRELDLFIINCQVGDLEATPK